ncbi:MAG: response regulator [Nitrososphaerales archaeon]
MLVVDDEADITRGVKMGLESRGFAVDAYNDPVEAVSGFKPGAYDLVILDIKMPRMNGFQVYRELKKTDQDVKVWFFTAFEVYQDEFSKIFPDVKVQKFLKKPMLMSFLAGEVNRFLDGSGADGAANRGV